MTYYKYYYAPAVSGTTFCNPHSELPAHSSLFHSSGWSAVIGHGAGSRPRTPCTGVTAKMRPERDWPPMSTTFRQPLLAPGFAVCILNSPPIVVCFIPVVSQRRLGTVLGPGPEHLAQLFAIRVLNCPPILAYFIPVVTQRRLGTVLGPGPEHLAQLFAIRVLNCPPILAYFIPVVTQRRLGTVLGPGPEHLAQLFAIRVLNCPPILAYFIPVVTQLRLGTGRLGLWTPCTDVTAIRRSKREWPPISTTFHEPLLAQNLKDPYYRLFHSIIHSIGYSVANDLSRFGTGVGPGHGHHTQTNP
jgi:hypothetical protein